MSYGKGKDATDARGRGSVHNAQSRRDGPFDTHARRGSELPREMNAVYHRQRATAGLIISEATSVSPFGYGYYGTPGIHTEEQRDAWKRIADVVHEEGGLIFLQLWHVGRISHQDLQPGRALPVSASAIRPRGSASTRDGLKPHPTPRALRPEEIAAVIEEYRRGAQLSMQADPGDGRAYWLAGTAETWLRHMKPR